MPPSRVAATAVKALAVVRVVLGPPTELAALCPTDHHATSKHICTKHEYAPRLEVSVLLFLQEDRGGGAAGFTPTDFTDAVVGSPFDGYHGFRHA